MYRLNVQTVYKLNLFKFVKVTGILVILLSGDGFKCDPETKLKQSLCKVNSKAAIRRCSSKQVLLKISHRCFPVNIAKFLRASFLYETSCGSFFQFDKVTVQHWASADLLFLINNTVWDGFYKKVCRSVQSTLYYWQKPFHHVFVDKPTENKNLFKVKHCSKGYLF